MRRVTPVTVGGLVLPLKGGVVYGEVCVYYTCFNFRNRLHIDNKKEIAALA